MSKKVLIIGGAGFIGCNTAKYYLENNDEVFIMDNLSRDGTEHNIDWLRSNYSFNFFETDIRNQKEVEEVISNHPNLDLIIHLAGQVAVTTSVEEPRYDFEANALGTFNILEAMRKADHDATLIFSSTNKVYGKIEESLVEKDDHYSYEQLEKGISEERNLDFYSPYGCSKGAADQYVRDYARIYGLNTVVFRQSCIYGPHQFGVEDQGWVAWFSIAAQTGRDITIFGDGKQVRDVLYVEDLIEAFEMAHKNRSITSGEAYNIGGGPTETLSLLQFLNHLESALDKAIDIDFDEWRPGDQKIYISDISKAQDDFGWEPETNFRDGVAEMLDWISNNKKMIEKVLV
jgi:CDP-paratose 2-epimerase